MRGAVFDHARDEFVQPGLHLRQFFLQFLLASRVFVNLEKDVKVLRTENVQIDQILHAVVETRIVIATIGTEEQLPLVGPKRERERENNARGGVSSNEHVRSSHR